MQIPVGRVRHRLNRVVRLQVDDPEPAAAHLFAIRDALRQ